MESPDRLFPAAIPVAVLILLAATLTGYARFVMGYPICGTDEQNYLKIFAWLDQGGVWPISGPGYAKLIMELRHWTGWETRDLVVAVAILNSSVVLPLGLIWLYRTSLGSTPSAWQCVLWLFAGSYFLSSWLEGRPQQFGMLLTIVGAWCAYLDLQETGHCRLRFYLLWVLCFGYHALSFIVLTTLVFGFWAMRFVQGHSGYKALAALLLGLISCLALGALWYPLIWLDIRVNHIRGIPVGVFFAAVIVSVVGGFLLLHDLRRYQIGSPLIHGLRAGLASPPIHGVVVAIVTVALIWQYIGLGHIYQSVPLGMIVWYQSGNLLLAILFLAGLWRFSREPVPKFTFFIESCVILMVLGGIFLALMPWLRDQNWTLRILSYWTWYAAPLAAWGWLGLPNRWRWGLLLTFPLLLTGGLHHALDAPTWTCSTHT